MEADQDRDGKISFKEFTKMVENTDVSMSMTLGMPSELLIAYPIPNTFTWSQCDKVFLILTVRQINSSKYPLAKTMALASGMAFQSMENEYSEFSIF